MKEHLKLLLVAFLAVTPAFGQSPDSLFIDVGTTVIVELAKQDTLEDGTIDVAGAGLYTLQTKHEIAPLWDTQFSQKEFAFSGNEEIELEDTFIVSGTYRIRAKVERFVSGNTAANQILPETAWSKSLIVIVEADDIRKLKTVRIFFGN